jgi:transposase-like protein
MPKMMLYTDEFKEQAVRLCSMRWSRMSRVESPSAFEQRDRPA